MPDRTLPDHPSLEQYRKQAKELASDCAAGNPLALARVRKHHPRLRTIALGQSDHFTLVDAQLVLAREHGYESWPKFAKHLETLRIIHSLEALSDPVNTFLEVGCIDIHGWHGSGTLEHAEMLLARYPDVATASIYTAAILADEPTVRAFLAKDPALAKAPGGPHLWDALTHLCFSRYLRLDKSRAESFTATARALLEAGANANTGWWDTIDDPPRQVPETAIYGAAGIAQHPSLTQLLLDFGADPNDEETPYHVPETYDNTVLQILLKSGRFNEKSPATVTARKADWHDEKGLKVALESGANPNYQTVWEFSPFQHSIRRDNGLVMIEMLLDHGADPCLTNGHDGRNAIQMAAYHGRGDILAVFERRGFDIRLEGIDALVAACACADVDASHEITKRDPDLLAQLLSMGGTLLARFSGADNVEGVRCLLALGISPGALWSDGDGYWELAKNSTALHVAAWRAHHEVVRTLIAAGTPVNARDARNRTAIQLAVKACTDSYWKYRRRPDSVAALLAAGALTEGIDLPTGYDAIDTLLLAERKPLSG